MSLVSKNSTVKNCSEKTLKKASNDPKQEVSIWQLQFGLLTTKEKFLAFLSLFSSLIVGGVTPIFDVLAGEMIGIFVNPNPTNEDITRDVRNACLYAVYFGVGMFASTMINELVTSILNISLSSRIRSQYFDLVIRQNQEYFDSINVSELTTKMQSQIETISKGLTTKLNMIIKTGFYLVFTFIISFFISWKVSLALLIVVPVILFVCYMIVKTTEKSYDDSKSNFLKAGSIVEEVLYNIKTVLCFCNFDYEKQRFNDEVEQCYLKTKSSSLKNSIYQGLLILVIFGSYTVALKLGMTLIKQNEVNGLIGGALNIGNIITIVYLLILGSRMIGLVLPNLSEIFVATEAAKDFFELKRAYQMKSSEVNKSLRQCKSRNASSIELMNKLESPSVKGHIKFSNVSFSYPNSSNLALSKLNLEFESCSTTAIVGGSGSGKSTIINLIEKIYDPTSGLIELDGVDIRQIDEALLRAEIGYVPQEPSLFNYSIRENILFGREGVSDADLEEACLKSGVNEFLNSFSSGLDTIVGVKGSLLSGGQRQRIAIARAILKKPKIFILDEATSALDPKIQNLVQESIKQISKACTTIIIAHRLSTIKFADRIVVLDKGKVAEEGNHSQLVDAKGKYWKLLGEINEVESEESSKGNLEVQYNCSPKSCDKMMINPESAALKDQSQSMTLNSKVEDISKFSQAKKSTLNTRTSKRLMWNLLIQSPYVLALSLFFGIISSSVWPLYGYAIANSSRDLSDLELPDIDEKTNFYVAVFVSLAVVASVSTMLVDYLYSILSAELSLKFRRLSFEKLLKLKLSFFDEEGNSPGSLLNLIANDTEKTKAMAIFMSSYVVKTGFALVLGIGIALIYCWQVTLLCLGFIPITMGASMIQSLINNSSNSERQSVETELNTFMSECFNNSRTLACFNMQAKVSEWYNEKLKSLNRSITSHLLAALVSAFIISSIFFSFAAIIKVSETLYINQGTSLTSILISILLINFGAYGLGETSYYINDLDSASSSVSNINNLLVSDQEEINESFENKLTTARITEIRNIEFSNVYFAYPSRNDIPVLKDLSFLLDGGKSFAFIGGSGSGKSTILQLLLRLYKPDSGKILINGKDIKEYPTSELRKMFGIVNQEPTMFKTTLLKNISYGDLSSGLDRITKSVENALINIPLDCDLSVTQVSGGEKQRIAIARCFLRDAPIILLDEATSALDNQTELLIQESISKLIEGRTSLIVAHKLNTIEKCSKIFVMSKGEIFESGTHEDLLKSKGVYWEMQQAH